MAAFALLNEYLAINSNALGDHVKECTLTVEAEALSSEAMGDSWKEVTAGLKSGTISIKFLDDVAASNLDSILWGLFGTVTTFEVRPDAGAVSTSNPKYTGSIFIAKHALGGQLGEMAMKDVEFPTSGTVTRATS